MLGFKATLQQIKQHIQLLAFCAVLSLLTGFVSHYQMTVAFDRFVFDWAQRFAPLTIGDDVVIIEIDDKSIAQLGRWPWSRDTHAALINTLQAENANTIAFDILFADYDKTNPQADQAFTNAIQQHGNVILPLHIEKLGTQGQMLEVLPAKSFVKAAAGLGHVHVAQDSDGVTRSVFLKEGVGNAFWPHFSVTIHQHYAQPLATLPGEQNHQQNMLPEPNTIARDYLNYIPVTTSAPNLTYFSYADVLAQNTAKNAFNNKLVFIGATATGLGDVLTTSVGAMAGVELNAWIYEALRQDKLIQHAGPSVTLAINLLATFILLIILGRLAPKALLLASLASVLGLLGLSIGLQNYFSVWLPLSPALFALCMFYPLWSWLRLEIAVKFLKSELHQLNEHPHQLQFEIKQAEKGLNYLQDLGILSRWESSKRTEEKNTPANFTSAENDEHVFLLHTDTAIIRAYLSKQYLQKIPSDWQMAKRAQALFNRFYTRNNTSPYAKGSGTEVISQTVAQLSAVKQSEEISQRLLQQSLAKLQDGVIIANMYGTVLFANDAFSAMTGRTVDSNTNLMDAIGQLSLKDSNQWRPLIASLYADRKSISGQAANTNTNVDLFFQARTENIYGDFEDTIIITFTNITEVRAAEKAKMEALNFLSHDLRAPMLSVLAVIERHRTNCAEANFAEHQAFTTIETLVRQNLSYAEDFLQLSRAQTLKESQFHFCDLHAIFDGAHKNALALARAKNVSIQTQKADVDAWVMGDHTLLERALTNIITNAIKYSPKNSFIQLNLAQAGNQFEIAVQDNGIGINNKDLKTIFERFSRGKSGNKEHGAGLGLYFAALVAKQHAGDIEVESELGKGSVFKLVLPACAE